MTKTLGSIVLIATPFALMAFAGFVTFKVPTRVAGWKAQLTNRGPILMAGGQAVLGFYPKSEVIDTNGIDLAGPLPPDIQLTTIYGAAVTAKSTAPDAAAAFIAFMRAPANRAAWAKAGFDPPPA